MGSAGTEITDLKVIDKAESQINKILNDISRELAGSAKVNVNLEAGNKTINTPVIRDVYTT